MRPVPISDELVWEGARRMVVGPPDGDPTNDVIRSVEALVDADDLGPRFCILIDMEDGDLERLQNGERIWLIWHAQQLAPFSIAIHPTK